MRRRPIPKTHTRLRDAHEGWHATLAAYPDADEFCRSLNSLIRDLRSVTFVLQKEMRHKEGFNEWYAREQEGMRADPTMKWLHEARTQIDKEGDLETHSTAHVTIKLGWDEEPVATLEVPPFAGPKEIASLLRYDQLPEPVRDDGLVVVERRWVVDDLPDRELMEAIAHCYGCIAGIVREAHALCGVSMQTFGGESHEGRHVRHPHPSGKLPCMLVGDDARTAFWHLGRDEIVEVSLADHKTFYAVHEIEPGEHYADLGTMPPIPEGHLVEQGATWHEWAKRILMHDGHHQTLAWIFDGSHKGVQSVELNFDDQQEKALAIRKLAELVNHLGAHGLIYTGEAWSAPALKTNDPRADLRAGLRDDRSEVLVTWAATSDGQSRAYFTPMTRARDGTLEALGETSVLDEIPPQSFLEPIRRVGRSWPTES